MDEILKVQVREDIIKRIFTSGVTSCLLELVWSDYFSFYIIQLMTFYEVNYAIHNYYDNTQMNTRIDQPLEHDIHRGILGEYHVPWVDQSLYSPKLKVINCFII